MYPSAPATLKEVVTEVRWRGSRLRTALAGAEPVVAAAGAGTDVAEVDPPDSGWPCTATTARSASRCPAGQPLPRPSRHRQRRRRAPLRPGPVSYTHLRAHETDSYLVCRLLHEKK